jgi:hypothetical protein
LKVLASLLFALCCLLALPAAASAVTYTVDSTLDEADSGGLNGICLTAGGKCTLRAAIQESNASALVVDEIHFDATFNGQLADTITLGSLLPPIANPVSINAGLCATQAGQSGPCAGVEASALSYGLSVENTDTVEISGLAITGATTGIRVVNSSKSFSASNNWLGEKLDGSNGSGSNTGIWLDPESDNAIIGGMAAGQGNVFVNNSFEGLDIEGASNADVLGNYFGVKADGVTVAANGKNVEITDTNSFEAIGNEVGTKVEGAALASTACDGGCNVISGGGTSTGVNLVGETITGEEPATGPTTVRGNFVGLAADGTTLRANGTFNILVGGAKDAKIGGESTGEANYIAGGGYGVFLENGEGLKAVGNIMGSALTGADVTPPGVGVFLICTNNTLPVQVRSNVIRMEGGVGVEARFGGAEITSNFIEGAEFGVKTTVAPGPAGSNLIEKNVIGEPTVNGIRIEDDGNLVFGNSVYKSGAAGIRLQAPVALLNADKNRIGGNTDARENNIRESGGDAIEIDNTGEEETSQNEVARNKGDSNTGLFIDLIGATTNGGIQPPAFATSIQSSASGTGALSGATIRVFRKKTAAAGELESTLGEATADGSGAWKVTYAGQIPTGTSVAATQTSAAGGTSELSIATTAADPVIVVDPGKKGKGDDPKPDKEKPRCKNMTGKCSPGEVLETTITKAPKARTHSTTARFKFSSTTKGAKFECKLDRKKFKPCKSPKTYKGLKPGKHVFKVRAVKGKSVDPTPAKRKFKILR